MEKFAWLRGRSAELATACEFADWKRVHQLITHTHAEGGAEAAEYLVQELHDSIYKLAGYLN